MAFGPFEPSANARAFALNNWDTYRAHIEAGFAPEQAMQFLCAMFQSACIANAINPNQNGTEDK